MSNVLSFDIETKNGIGELMIPLVRDTDVINPEAPFAIACLILLIFLEEFFSKEINICLLLMRLESIANLFIRQSE